jgi:hypothetical protein
MVHGESLVTFPLSPMLLHGETTDILLSLTLVTPVLLGVVSAVVGMIAVLALRKIHPFRAGCYFVPFLTAVGFAWFLPWMFPALSQAPGVVLVLVALNLAVGFVGWAFGAGIVALARRALVSAIRR